MQARGNHMRRIFIGLVWASVALVVSYQMALAAPTKLICNNEIYPNSPPTTIDVDEAGHTVFMHDYQGMGPLPAVFDPEKITFIWVQVPGAPGGLLIIRLIA
jgi:hypothetical protein